MFVGLPIIGWGIMDFGGFFESSARVTFLVLVCILNAFAAIRIPEIGKKRAEQKTTVKRQHLAVMLFQLLSISLVLVSPFCDRRSIATTCEGEVGRYFGLLFYLAGFLTMHFSEWYLGKQFSVDVGVQEEHKLVSNGTYTYLLHPRYLGIILFTIGIALVFRSWIGLALAAATIGVVFWRIHDEEELMREEFGSEWEEFARERWRLIPFVY